MSPAEKFEKAPSVFDRQVGEATQYWFAASTINEVAKKNRRVFIAFQRSPTFWLTVRAGLEHQAIVAVRRIFGQRGANPVNIDSLRDLVHNSRTTVFSKRAFRDRGKPAYLVERFHDATDLDVRRLSNFIKKYRNPYEEQFAAIRNRYVAHTDDLTDEEVRQMFANTRVRAIERMLEFANRLHDALWHWYHNGRRPTFRARRSSVRAMVRDRVDVLRRHATPEQMVSQTRKALDLVARGHSTES